MEWNRGPIIGRGSSAAVYLATKFSGDIFAVKSTELSSSSFLQREQNFLSKMNSPYIVRYLGSDVNFEDNKAMYNIFMEYLSGGALSDVIKKRGGSLEESMIRVYTNHILLGLDYLHSNNIVHCDIKGQNILLGKEGVKIADLGCATLLENGAAATSAFSGTPVFMAPEVARGEEQGFPSDIWSLGCTIIEMATGSNPWPELDHPLSAIHKIGFSGELPEFPDNLSDNAKDFLSKCLRSNAKERWTANQLLSHQFLVDSAFDFENVENLNKNSPTGVLDLGFWDSVQVSEVSLKSSELIYTSDDRARDRIRGLIASEVLPEWADDDDWVTVRINPLENNAQVPQQSCDSSTDSIHIELFDFNSFAEESESFIGIQGFLIPDASDVEIIGNFDTCLSTESELLSVTDINVSQISNFERQMNENLFLLIMSVVPAVHMHFTFSFILLQEYKPDPFFLFYLNIKKIRTSPMLEMTLLSSTR